MSISRLQTYPLVCALFLLGRVGALGSIDSLARNGARFPKLFDHQTLGALEGLGTRVSTAL